ncbi:hypothetical protein PRIPAC_92562 [Pristionchus pacificus]|uniref:Uncharacterized protein n=1 Tax=Pristionchus pacificus TaxID=54126 RepID=A0A2A6BAF3_PRIPA|nr:hypothetical protein PRIPAC_92562 [Pristionchus pacificus]|eukprot:PDM62846.1 hypothetical protein PRIPAC_50061 [Pristionchus pacificus]
MRGLWLLLCLLPLVTGETKCAQMAFSLDKVTEKLRKKDISEYRTIECDHYCVQNITHTDGKMWLISGCGTLECASLLERNPPCHRSSAIEKTHPSLYHYSCCAMGKNITKAMEHFFGPNNTGFLNKTSSQTLPREEMKTVVYVRTGVAALFAIAAIATQVVAVRLYRKKKE